MFLHRATRRARRAGMALVGLAVAAIVVGAAASGAWAGTAPSKVSGGTLHIYLTNTSVTSQTTKVLVTGAFSDHGIGKQAVMHLSKGTITVDPSKLTAKFNAPTFGTFNVKSCSFWGTATASVPVVSGTGAYAGITGTLTATGTLAEQGALRNNGTCNTASNAPAVAFTEIVVASGKVSF